jgi:phosphoribosylformylglycinamidine (FGAM) synthase-like amidotransferase family enzyme
VSRGTTKSVRVLLPTGFGINCEAETEHAFQLVGAAVDRLHINDLIAEPDRLSRCQILALAGGFSFGDHLGAGRALANRLRCRLSDQLDRFVEAGGLVLGICNGFQTMVRLGLLPAGRPGPQQVSLTHNQHGAFHDGWVSLTVDPQSPCLFTRGIERIELPVRHGEGRLVLPTELRTQIDSKKLVPLRYGDPQTGQATLTFPHNPNGSADAAAGLCDETGRVFGLMPHPEAFLYPENHPNWRRRARAAQGAGVQLFENAVTACRA